MFSVQDPAVQQATANTGGVAGAGLDDYDPFNKQKTTTVGGGGSQPAVMSPTQEAAPAPAQPPQYTQSAQQQVTAADFQVRSSSDVLFHQCLNLNFLLMCPVIRTYR